MNDDPADLRRSYDRSALPESDADPDPIRQFARWFDDAVADRVYEPNAMILATADAAGRPSARTVLLKGYDNDGFAFYTNLESRKASELAANPQAALLFYWDRLHRQVRIEGRVEPVAAEVADRYFASRPYGSRIGAWASPQSRPVANRTFLESEESRLRQRFPETEPVPRPPFWGGLRVVPASLEFWQGRPSRLHDRLRYSKGEHGWTIDRLAP